MPPAPSRRTALRGLAVAGAVVIGFDPATQSWAAAADGSADANGKLSEVPTLDGTLVTDTTALDAAADDYGHTVHRRPAAVLRPGSVADVVAMVRFCNEQGIKVAPRGQGHATYGQAQVDGGLVIETATLSAIGAVRPDNVHVTVGAGVKWSDLTKATLTHGLTPPVFTDYLELSVGGTLSVGGIGGQAHRHGAQVDNVVELEVVTGAGELVRCSATRRPDLFDAVRAGLGQCAIVVGATVRLVPAPETVRHYLLPYDDLDTFLDDQRLLAAEGRFDYLEGQVTADSAGVFGAYAIEAVAYGPPVGENPDDATLLAGLRHDPSKATITDLGYYDFLDRIAPAVAQLKAAGLWDYAHPWLNLLVPGATIADVAASVLGDLTPDDLGPGLVLLYPVRRDRFRTPLLRVPDDPTPYLFAVLAATPADDTAKLGRLLTANRTAYDTARAAGGTNYPVGSIPFERADWEEHYGAAWPEFRRARATYDPRGVLVPGQGIF
ncbi:Cytokinin dehydrogenase [Actinobacteria bacterium OK074]|nr:Cytokinin dehydrogenase [Actinobacteria bacterium OK074]